MVFDPEELTPESSLNRVVIVDLPGYGLDRELRGKTAYELLGIGAWVSAIKERSTELDLYPEQTHDEHALPFLLHESLTATDQAVREAATEIVASFGRRLGLLIAVLKRGDAVNRQARPEWDESYWTHWAGVRQIWLGGGLASDELGRVLQRTAEDFLKTAGVENCALHLPDYPALLPLIGAARCRAVAAKAAFVADFGQSYIKSGLAHYKDGVLTALDTFLPVPSQPDILLLAEAMAKTLADGLKDPLAPIEERDSLIVVSVASYVKDNHPFAYKLTPYAQLSERLNNLGDWLADRVSNQVGRHVKVALMHDGTAAAQVFAGAENAAVIMVGTALGCGFPWTERKVLRMAPEFAVSGIE
jgi:hypothetical protein